MFTFVKENINAFIDVCLFVCLSVLCKITQKVQNGFRKLFWWMARNSRNK